MIFHFIMHNGLLQKFKKKKKQKTSSHDLGKEILELKKKVMIR